MTVQCRTFVDHHFSSKNIACEMNNGRGKFKRVNCLKSPRVKNSNEAKHSRGVQPVWGFRVANFSCLSTLRIL